MYQVLDIYLVLVGVEVWTDRNLVDVTTDPTTTLNSFAAYRSQNINPYHPNDNAHLIRQAVTWRYSTGPTPAITFG